VSTLEWTEAHDGMVRDLIAEEVEKTRLSHKFIPELRIEEKATSVRADKLKGTTVDDVSTIPLVELAVAVTLTKEQAEDADFSAAQILIRRAANQLARAHDAVIFAGQPGPNALPTTAPTTATARYGEKNSGLTVKTNPVLNVTPPTAAPHAQGAYGEALVAAVAAGLVQLEGAGYIGSYVLILGQDLFTEANTPSSGSLVLPTDRISALLGSGPIHRTSVLQPKEGLLISLGGEPMDCAVAIPPRFEFLRVGNMENRDCRVFERFALRLKESQSVLPLLKV